MEFVDSTTGIRIADPEAVPLAYLPSAEDVRRAAGEMILSASGWRMVFAGNGDEESFGEEPAPEGIILASAAALAFSEMVWEESGGETPTVAVAVDTRPTGPEPADAV